MPFLNVFKCFRLNKTGSLLTRDVQTVAGGLFLDILGWLIHLLCLFINLTTCLFIKTKFGALLKWDMCGESGFGWKMKWKKLCASFGRIDSEFKESIRILMRHGRRTCTYLHYCNRTITLSTQPRQCGLGTTLWMSLSGSARALTGTQTNISRENWNAWKDPIQPDRAWEDLQRRTAENPRIQACKACRVIPKKTRRSQPKVLQTKYWVKGLISIHQCDISVFPF